MTIRDTDTVLVKDNSKTYHDWSVVRTGTNTACGRTCINTLWTTGWVEMTRLDAGKLKKARCKACARVRGD